MGWNNPPVSWREFERRLSWGKADEGGGERADGEKDANGSAANGSSAGGSTTGGSTTGGSSADGTTTGGTSLARRRIEPELAEDVIPWAELHCHSSYSFLDGASDPDSLIKAAATLGLSAIAITDHDGMYGVPQFAQAATRFRMREADSQAGDGGGGKAGDLRTVFGAELSLTRGIGRTGVPDPEGNHLLVLARDPDGYRRLCQVISAAHLAGGEKGRPDYDLDQLSAAHDGHWVILTGCRKSAVPAALADGRGRDQAEKALRALTDVFGRDNVMVELISHDQPADDERNDALFELASHFGLGAVATNNVHYATPADARLAQVLAAIRARSSLDEMDGWLAASSSAYIRSGKEMTRRLRRYPGVFERTVDLGRQCAFDFKVIAPKLPDFKVPEGETEMSYLRSLVAKKAPQRYGDPGAEHIPGAYRQISHELDVIETLGFAGYFLIVHDIVEFCDRKGLACQGRGSAANSAVCYALGITSVDPVQHGLLFERFLSTGRDGPPDIDLDIEHHRREDAIQYVYDKYGRDRAAQVANVIAYRPRMAIRDAGRALGYPPEQQNAWSKQVGPRQYKAGQPVPPDAGIPEQVLDLAMRMQRLPRHLGIHSGGMVICDRPVAEVC